MKTTPPQVPSIKDGAAMDEAIKQRDAIIARLELENKLLRDKIDLLIRRVFGRSSEALDEQQLTLLLQGEDAAAKKPPPPVRTPPAWRLNLPKVTSNSKQRLHVANANRACPMICL